MIYSTTALLPILVMLYLIKHIFFLFILRYARCFILFRTLIVKVFSNYPDTKVGRVQKPNCAKASKSFILSGEQCHVCCKQKNLQPARGLYYPVREPLRVRLKDV